MDPILDSIDLLDATLFLKQSRSGHKMNHCYQSMMELTFIYIEKCQGLLTQVYTLIMILNNTLHGVFSINKLRCVHEYTKAGHLAESWKISEWK